MRKIALSILLIFVVFACQSKKETDEAIVSNEQLTLITDYNDLFAKFTKNDDKLYVINYWATWCKPCVEELPDFMEVNNELKDNAHFKMILVSLDKASALETDVQNFIKDNNISTDVYLLSDNKRQMQWIPKVNERWSGAIPSTAFYKNGEQVAFVEGQLNKQQLKEIIHQHL
ncbi:MAG TPA: thioredoxin domain-containing protein [Flavobacterium sp.]|nr:thioredoxin domain-containing protein [Flavobacterium sp.]